MSEWWTYRLYDFLLFTPRTYYRLFELYNAAIWPAQLPALALGVALLVLARRTSASSGRAISGILAAGWLWVAIAFHATRYATINTAAVYLAWMFGLEAVLLLWLGIVRDGLACGRPADPATRIGIAVFLLALLVEPLSAPILGRSWRSAEIFGLAPDPTAVGTLGLLLLATGRRRWLLMVIPVLWCAVTGATLSTMNAPDFWVAPALAVLAVSVAARPWRVFRRV
jgi:hypothetical protein